MPNTEMCKLEAEKKWIGVDLDGTLAEYHQWEAMTYIGPPIELMVNRVKEWLNKGMTVKIFTARAVEPLAIPYIEKWCEEHIGQVLEVTNVKDLGMIELWDDRAIRVEKNTGKIRG